MQLFCNHLIIHQQKFQKLILDGNNLEMNSGIICTYYPLFRKHHIYIAPSVHDYQLL